MIKSFYLCSLMTYVLSFGQTEIVNTYISGDSLTYITLMKNGDAALMKYHRQSPIMAKVSDRKATFRRTCGSGFIVDHADYGTFKMDGDSLWLDFSDVDHKKAKIKKEYSLTKDYRDSIKICISGIDEIYENGFMENDIGVRSIDGKLDYNNFRDSSKNIHFKLARNQLPMTFLTFYNSSFTIDTFLNQDITIYRNLHKQMIAPDKKKVAFSLSQLFEER